MEILSASGNEGGAVFTDLPPLSCDGFSGASVVAVEESDSAAGEVLLLGGIDENTILSTVRLVDLATGACVPQNNLFRRRVYQAAGRLPDGRIVCAGAIGGVSSAEIWGPPEQGGPDAAWSWRELPEMIGGRYGCGGCGLCDGRFAVLGGENLGEDLPTSSCEALAVDVGDAPWEPLSLMHDARSLIACGVIAGCIIAAGGLNLKSAELYDVELNR